MTLLCVTAGAQERLTLSESVDRTLANNPELSIDEPALDAARAELAASRGQHFPELGVRQSYAGGNNPVYVFGTKLSQGRFTGQDFDLSRLNAPHPIDNLQTQLSARQTLWDFGRTSNRVESSKLGVDLAVAIHRDNLLRVLLSVLDAYYSVSLARERLKAARIAEEAAESIRDQARARVESGVSVEADLLRSQVHLAAAQRLRIDSQGELEVAMARLNRVMGSALDAPQGLTDDLVPVDLPLPGADELRDVQRLRPDYQRLQIEVRQAESTVGARKSALLPVLNAFGTWELNKPSGMGHTGSNWFAGLDLQWNLSVGGTETAMLRAARYRSEQRRRQLNSMERSMDLELHGALIRCRSAERQVEIAVAAEKQGSESLRIMRNRYQEGLATITDLLATESARASARTSLAESIYRHRLSFAQVEFVAGVLSPTSRSMNP